MAKASRPGNQAVAGIKAAETDEERYPDYVAPANTSSSQSGAGSSSNKGSTSTKSSSSSSVKSSSSTSSSTKSNTGSNTGSNAGNYAYPEVQETPYDQKFYAALAAGVPNGINASEYIAKDKAADAVKGVVSGAKAYVGNGSVAPIDYVDIAQQKAELRARENQEKARAVLAADYAVNKGVNELTRNLQDSRALYQTQRNQVNADEAKALDNQVLYAEARGDRGGIGMSQYGGIQNTAATNRQVINSAEVKLQTDTARQIADLRAQGEFEKADKVLEISNKYLTELQNLEKWAKEKNVGVQEFNAKLREWENEYILNVGKYLTDAELNAVKAAGIFSNGAETANYRDALQDRYAAGAKAMMDAGIVPSADQLASMGWTPEQFWIYKMAQGY
ncbi:MAG: hypothetical protein IJG40_04050 [Oscillospiraceae bacterium]|nr:hypothetical protein [Oscillospiraceae bacterium]